MFEALLGQLEAEARHRPVLMVFEDAHWIDPTSRELLDLGPAPKEIAQIGAVLGREFPPAGRRILPSGATAAERTRASTVSADRPVSSREAPLRPDV